MSDDDEEEINVQVCCNHPDIASTLIYLQWGFCDPCWDKYCEDETEEIEKGYEEEYARERAKRKRVRE